MYWTIFSVITIFIILFAVGFVFLIKEGVDAFSMFVGTLGFGFIMFLFIKFKTYDTGKPIEIPIKNVSIMKDNELVIVRYKGYQETFKTKKEYDAITDSSFVLQEITEYNIQNEENGKIYKVVIKEKL